jgi:ssDNA-binding Zn-finger/Zn-ribbon topoisomerase 1
VITCPHCQHQATPYDFVGGEPFERADDETIDAVCPKCSKGFNVRKVVTFAWFVLN